MSDYPGRNNYDLAGSLVKTNYPDGSTINYQFDNGGRLTSINDFKLNGSLNAFYKYTLDQLGNRTGISFSQPLNVKPTPVDTTYTPDVDNRLLTAGSISFGYDNNGNLITKTLGSNVTNYSWDFNDMLTQVTKDGTTYTYRYDALGSRVAKTMDSVETRYVGGLAETDVSGNITAYYVYGLGLISKISPTNQSYFYHFDGLGSTIAVTDSSGAIVNKYAYDEHGKVLNQEEGISNAFKYVGRFGVMDEGNGLLYMRARYYDPEVGRFISKDPIGFAGGDLNLYAYVQSNPVNGVDPLGLWTGALRLNFTSITADFTIAVAIDGEGNIGLLITPAVGLSLSAGATGGITGTNAPCIKTLEGMGTSAGVAFNVPKMGPLQGEVNHVWSGGPTQYKDSRYKGMWEWVMARVYP